MSEPNTIQDSSLQSEKSAAQLGFGDAAAWPTAAGQAAADFGMADLAGADLESVGVAQLRVMTRHQGLRIRNLEQALDDSLLSLKDLRSQLIEQNFLEEHLAATEEIANVQQQAILNLKQQLQQLQQKLAQQPVGEDAAALNPPNTPAEKVAAAGRKTKSRTGSGPNHAAAQDAEWGDFPILFGAQQQRMAALEAESLSARVFAASLGVWLHQALTEVRSLAQQVSDRAPQFHQLELRLQQALQQTQVTLQRHQGSMALEADIAALSRETLEQASASLGDRGAPLPTAEELAIAQAKVEDLETEMARQMSLQTLLQHANRELEQDREQQQARLADLERNTADLQEQVLQQAQQASEYQTAIQHWKDRYVADHSQIQRLWELLSVVLPDVPAEVAEILASLQDRPASLAEPGSPELFVASAQEQWNQSPSTKLDLPDFLMRRRQYKARQSS